jgi:hypothetical protein
MIRVRLALAACVAVALSAAAVQAQQPKPAPEMDKLKTMVGTWDALVKTDGGDSKSTAVYKVDLGGMWVSSDFTGEFGGMKFHGKGMDTYDPVKKKYVSVWMDSMSTSPMILEGTFDKDGKVLTMTGEGPGHDGKPAKFKSISSMKDKDSMTFTMFILDKDGKEQKMMTIDYTRKK